MVNNKPIITVIFLSYNFMMKHLYFLFSFLFTLNLFSFQFVKEYLSVENGTGIPGSYFKKIISDGDKVIYSEENILTFSKKNPDNSLEIISRISLFSDINSLILKENIVYVGLNDWNLDIISIENLEKPVLKKEILIDDIIDMCTYKEFLYVLGRTGSFNIYDISTLDEPVYLDTIYFSGFLSAFSIYGDKGVLSFSDGRLFLIDLSNPSNPDVISTITFGQGEIWFNNIALIESIAYVVKWGGFDFWDIWLIDFRDISNPYLLKKIKLQSSGINNLKIYKNILGIASNEGFFLYDVNFADSPKFLSAYPLKDIWDFIIMDGVAYAVCNGVHCLDISNPSSLQLVSRVMADPNGGVLFRRDSTNYLATPQGGLSIYDFTNPLSPFLVSYYEKDYSKKICIENDLAYLGVGGGYYIIYINDLSQMEELSSIFFFSGYNDFIVKNKITFLSHNYGIILADNREPKYPHILSSISTEEPIYKLSFFGDILVGCGENNIYFIDVSNLNELQIINTYSEAQKINDFLVEGNLLFYSTNKKYVALDISNIYEIKKIGEYFEKENFNLGSFDVFMNYAYIKANYDCIRIIDLNNPQKMNATGLSFINKNILNLKIISGYLFVSFDKEATYVYNLESKNGIKLEKIIDVPKKIYSFDFGFNKFLFTVTKDSIEAYDTSNPLYFKKISEIKTPGPGEFRIYKNFGYLRLYGSPITIVYDISDMYEIKELGEFHYYNLINIFFYENLGIISFGNKIVKIVYMNDPLNPDELSTIQLEEIIIIINAYKNILALSADRYLYLYNISNPLNPIFLSKWESFISDFPYGGYCSYVEFKENIIFYLDWDSIYVISISDPYNPYLINFFQLHNIISNETIYDNILITINGGILFLDIKDPADIKILKKIEYSGFNLKRREKSLYFLKEEGGLCTLNFSLNFREKTLFDLK